MGIFAHSSGNIVRIVLAAALALTAVSAQEPAAPAPSPPSDQAAQPPRFRTEANYVRVDVYPTRGGQPVQDLRAEEFEVLENGARQEIQAFEHIVISPAGPQSMRVEADSVAGGETMAASPRNRVFVFFLDVPHVAVEGGHRIKEPLIHLMDRVLGPDDLVAVMTPEMSAAQITFGRKTEVIAEMLLEKWTWGMRHSILPMDSREKEYEICFPPGVAAQLIARRRERIVLDALHDLVRYLGGVREERKAILTVTEGWTLFRPDASVTALRDEEEVPGKDPVGVDGQGKLRINPPPRGMEEVNTSSAVCNRERMHLAAIDNEEYFRQLLDAANRNNASFYPIDPRGLAVFDYPIGPAPPPPPGVDRRSLTTRIENLRTLAEGTDGLAVVNSNDLERGVRRIADDLTSYYLLGYYSSNAKLDGTFRRITVRVTRPGVDVRARRGYRAATAEEVNAARAAAAAPVPSTVRTTTAALETLARIRTDQRFSINAVPVRNPGTGVTEILVVGELHIGSPELARGGSVTIDLTGGTTASVTEPLKPGERTFVVAVPAEGGEAPIDVRARFTADGAYTPMSDGARVEASGFPQPLLFRRGPSTGNRLQPAADFRFSRTERLRLEVPLAADATPGPGRLLDRNAQPLQVPVQVTERTDEAGRRWLTADAVLAPLAAGDYVVEMAYVAEGTEQKVLTAVRVGR